MLLVLAAFVALVCATPDVDRPHRLQKRHFDLSWWSNALSDDFPRHRHHDYDSDYYYRQITGYEDGDQTGVNYDKSIQDGWNQDLTQLQKNKSN